MIEVPPLFYTNNYPEVVEKYFGFENAGDFTGMQIIKDLLKSKNNKQIRDVIEMVTKGATLPRVASKIVSPYLFSVRQLSNATLDRS